MLPRWLYRLIYTIYSWSWIELKKIPKYYYRYIYIYLTNESYGCTLINDSSFTTRLNEVKRDVKEGGVRENSQNSWWPFPLMTFHRLVVKTHERREAGERSRRVHEIARRRWNSTKGWLTKPGAKAAGLASCNLLRIKVQSYDVWRIVSRQMAFLERRSVKPD